MAFTPSHRVRTLQPSATIAVNNLRLELQAAGRRIINFSVGEPDFDTPEFVRRAAAEAAEAGWTRYTASAGVPALREAIARHVGELRDISVDPAEVIVTCGAKQACANIILALVDPGDEVLLPAPYWVSYPEMVRLAEGIPVAAPADHESGYKVTPAMLAEHMTPRVTGLVLNSPSNPTGAVYSADEIAALVAFAAEHDLWILSDEIYDQFIFEGEFVSPFAGSGRSRTLLVGGVSKSYAMTGWRIGWSVAEPGVTQAMVRLQQHTTSNATAVSQAAAIAALEAGPEAFVTGMVEEFRRRREVALARLAAIPRVSFAVPGGAFYVFLDVGDVLGTPGFPATASELCQELLEQHGIALVPGEAFGDPRGVRLSYACSLEDLEEGLALIAQYLTG